MNTAQDTKPTRRKRVSKKAATNIRKKREAAQKARMEARAAEAKALAAATKPRSLLSPDALRVWCCLKDHAYKALRSRYGNKSLTTSGVSYVTGFSDSKSRRLLKECESAGLVEDKGSLSRASWSILTVEQKESNDANEIFRSLRESTLANLLGMEDTHEVSVRKSGGCRITLSPAETADLIAKLEKLAKIEAALE